MNPPVFEFNGITYRVIQTPTSDYIERYDGPKLGWNRTDSMRVFLHAASLGLIEG